MKFVARGKENSRIHKKFSKIKIVGANVGKEKRHPVDAFSDGVQGVYTLGLGWFFVPGLGFGPSNTFFVLSASPAFMLWLMPCCLSLNCLIF